MLDRALFCSRLPNQNSRMAHFRLTSWTIGARVTTGCVAVVVAKLALPSAGLEIKRTMYSCQMISLGRGILIDIVDTSSFASSVSALVTSLVVPTGCQFIARTMVNLG